MKNLDNFFDYFLDKTVTKDTLTRDYVQGKLSMNEYFSRMRILETKEAYNEQN